jgi:uncharacterized protein YjiS (DUF1127 family)
MTHTVPTIPAVHSVAARRSVAAAILSGMSRTLHALTRYAEAELDRRRTAALLGYADFELRDIGISRADVYAALLAPAGEKPSDTLARGRDEHRCAELAQLREFRRADEH